MVDGNDYADDAHPVLLTQNINHSCFNALALLIRHREWNPSCIEIPTATVSQRRHANSSRMNMLRTSESEVVL